MTAKALPLFVWLLICACATLEAKEHWLYAKAPHLDVLTNYNEKESRAIVAKLENFRASITKTLGKESRKQTPLHLIIFKNDDELVPYKPLYKGKPGSGIAYFQGDSTEAVICMTGDYLDFDNSNVVLHEYTHRVLEDQELNLPPWLNEGLAEYFSTFSMDKKGVCLVGEHIQNHVDLLHERSRWMPLQELLTVSQSSESYNDEWKAGLFYAESWALVHFWLCGGVKQYQEGLVKFVGLMNEKQKTLEECFEAAFNLSFSHMEQDFKEYVRYRGNYRINQVTIPVVDFEKLIVFRPATAVEVKLAKIRAKWHMQRAGDAAYDLITLDTEAQGKNPEIYELLAAIALSDNDSEKAADYWEKACAAGSENPFVLSESVRRVLEARLQSGFESDVPDAIIAPLRTRTEKALSINPLYEQAWNNLALLEAISHRPKGANVKRFQTNVANLSNKMTTAYAVALLQYRTNAFDPCLETLKIIIDFKATPSPIKFLAGNLQNRVLAKKRMLALEKAAAAEEAQEHETKSPEAKTAEQTAGEPKTDAPEDPAKPAD